jgi:putative component of toxin-antitoxin plasmid stabilization module
MVRRSRRAVGSQRDGRGRAASKGNTSNVKPIGEGAAELKINRGPGHRIYFGWDGKVLVILLGRAARAKAAEPHRGRVAPLARLQEAQTQRRMTPWH